MGCSDEIRGTDFLTIFVDGIPDNVAYLPCTKPKKKKKKAGVNWGGGGEGSGGCNLQNHPDQPHPIAKQGLLLHYTSGVQLRNS